MTPLSKSARHALALALLGLIPIHVSAQGRIAAWGGDYFGVVSGAPDGTDYTQVAGGSEHSLALDANGSIVSWGGDLHGQVSNTPGGTGFTGIAGGGGHSLALSANGTIAAWGRDDLGQVSGTPGGAGYTQVIAKVYHSLALSADGSIASWGYDSHGQVSSTPDETGFTWIAAGTGHSVAVGANGSITSWGSDVYGQLSRTPVGAGFVQVGAGTTHSLALHADGSIVSWGDDAFGQVSGTPSGTGFSRVEAGNYHSLALRTDGSIVSWGLDGDGQVADTPAEAGFTQVAGGYTHSLAVLPYRPPPPTLNFADYWPISAGYSWKASSAGCPDPCRCPSLGRWEVQGPASMVPSAHLVGPTNGSSSAVLANTGSNFIHYGFERAGTYSRAPDGPHHLGSIRDGHTFQADASEEILIRDWHSITNASKALYRIPNQLDVVVWIHYDLQVSLPGNLHHEVMESGLPSGTRTPQGRITAVDWFVKGEGLYASMDIDATSGAPLPPVLDKVYLASLDCNGNGIFDHVDISNGTSADLDLDCIPDECGVTGAAYCFGDGSGTACPCNNSGSAGHGCQNSSGLGGRLSASGVASISGDTLVLSATQVLANQPGLFLQGTLSVDAGNGLAFGDGLRCAGGTLVRLEVSTPDGQGCVSSSLGLSTSGAVSPGETRRYQLWYRDPAGSPCGSGFNLTNGVEIVWSP